MDLTTTMSRDADGGFEPLLERHLGIVFKIANGYATHPADREDLVQEIAAQLWRAWPAYDPARRFSTWMYRIALNVAISHLRARQQRERHHVTLDEQVHGLAAPEPGDDARLLALQRCIAALDPMSRALLLLYLDERSQREIAEILGITETNVSTRISRLKQRIRDQLA